MPKNLSASGGFAPDPLTRGSAPDQRLCPTPLRGIVHLTLIIIIVKVRAVITRPITV